MLSFLLLAAIAAAAAAAAAAVIHVAFNRRAQTRNVFTCARARVRYRALELIDQRLLSAVAMATATALATSSERMRERKIAAAGRSAAARNWR